MKRLILILPLFLSACSTVEFIPNTGNEYVMVGNGGNLIANKNGVIVLNEGNSGNGLPYGQNCILLGLIEDSRCPGFACQGSKISDITKRANQVGANALRHTNNPLYNNVAWDINTYEAYSCM